MRVTKGFLEEADWNRATCEGFQGFHVGLGVRQEEPQP